MKRPTVIGVAVAAAALLVTAVVGAGGMQAYGGHAAHPTNKVLLGVDPQRANQTLPQ